MKKDEPINIPMDVHKEMMRRCFDTLTEYSYIIDFQEQRYHFLADQYLTHWGWTSQGLLDAGFDHYHKECHPDDLQLFFDMRKIVINRMDELGDMLPEISYFSFHYKLRFPHPGATDFLMVHLKMAPILIDNKSRYGAVSVSPSVVCTSGHLRTYYNASNEFEEYDFVSSRWIHGSLPHLFLQEQHILTLSRMGYDIKSIGDKMNLAPTTVRNIMTKMYRKLNVNSITQAVLYAMDHRMLYYPSDSIPRRESRKNKAAQGKLTPEMIDSVQLDWNKGQSLTAIAKNYNISEGSIRYAVRKGKLTAPPHLRQEQTAVR